MKIILSLLCLVILAGCATSDQRTVEAVNSLPRDRQPSYLAAQRDKGAITQTRYNDMMLQWSAHKAAEDDEKAALAAMTPKERAEYRLMKESVELQRQQLAAQEDEARMAGIRHVANSSQSLAQSNAANLNNSANTQAVVGAINAR